MIMQRIFQSNWTTLLKKGLFKAYLWYNANMNNTVYAMHGVQPSAVCAHVENPGCGRVNDYNPEQPVV